MEATILKFMHIQDYSNYSIKPTDLRGILKYVPMFRDQVFILALDGSLVAHDNLQNVLLDIAVLRSLNIKIVLVHGISHQLKALSKAKDITTSDLYGELKTDDATLELAKEAAAQVSLNIMQGLTRNKLRCALCNGVRSKEIGIIRGEDQLNTGTVDKLDKELIFKLLDAETIPLFSPIAFNREGTSLRINSDCLAAELASKLSASKVIFMTTQDDLKIEAKPITNIPVAELKNLLSSVPEKIPMSMRSKMQFAVKAIEAGTPRAHILDGRFFGALLKEVFDKVGIGTMVFSNDYQSIRRAKLNDAHTIYNITQSAVRTNSLQERSQELIEASIDDYLVYEIDGSIVSCLSFRSYGSIVEVGSVYVLPFYQNNGVGRKMIEYACAQAKNLGYKKIIAMTTQAGKFFSDICSFSEGTIRDLPKERLEEHRENGRNSKIFYQNL